jgi:hypothetical protein
MPFHQSLQKINFYIYNKIPTKVERIESIVLMAHANKSPHLVNESIPLVHLIQKEPTPITTGL